MEPYLEKLAGKLYKKFGDDISKICIVFPSRRAGVSFKQNYFSRLLKTPVWSPAVFSIEDFIKTLSPLPVGDPLTLIFELFETYKSFAADESFDKFYPWGEMLLGDFDDIDKYVIDADRLFRILYEHREVEQGFEFKLSDIDEFNKFWHSFSTKELTVTQESFIQTWEIMGKVYHDYRKRLNGNNICYEGMAYRSVYEMAKTKELNKVIEIEHGWQKIIFAGFNMLNKAEEGIIGELLKQGVAETYWDTDEYYLDNKIQEAGHFLRKNFSEFNISKEDILWKTNDLLKTKKNIRVIGTPMKISQAKALGNELKSAKEHGEIAVVLPDDSLLLPVLNSIPDNIDKLNISMGFPFKSSPLYSLLYLLKNIQSSGKGNNSSSSFYHKDIVQVLLHPYVKFTAPAEIYELVSHIKTRNIIYTSQKRILGAFTKAPEIISAIFNKTSTANESLEYIYRIIELISKDFEDSKVSKGFESEYLWKFYTELNHLSDIITRYSSEMDNETFWKLLIEITSYIKIPFTGEPIEGMQIMGLLETRLSDYKNVYILSMNEGTIPKGNTHGSFIPYNLRKGLKMPVFEDEDANSAYNFYRLLQRAENVTLIYNTEPGRLIAGEKSRFIMQVEQELALGNKNITLQNLIMQADVDIPARSEITIQKSDEVLELLRSKKHFSATALSLYINCPLQFYFRTVTGLKEQDEVEEFFSGGGFGSILHKIMEMLYTQYIGKEVNEEALLRLKEYVSSNYEKIWEDACSEIPEYSEFKSGLTGKNLLYKNIIKKLIEKILENDILLVPFKILSLENKIEKELTINIEGIEQKVKLLGILDRVQQKNDVENIVDYKTGSVKLDKLKGIVTSENISGLFENPELKEKFQQYFYCSIYLGGEAKKIKAGIYPLKNMSEGLKFFDENYIPAEILNLYEDRLKELLVKIFDSTTPFSQTTDIERCKYCPYQSICYRD